MDPITQQTVLAAAGAAGGGGKVYVDDVFSTFLYEGTGNTRTITNGIDLDGEGGLVWIKNRDASTNHWLFDTEQSTQNSIKYLRSDSSNAGGTVTDYLTAFNSNGFDLGTNAQVNNSGDSTCAWSFRKAPGFFDVVTWNAASLPADNLVAHNLGSVPGMIICKNIDADTEWQIYHRSATSSSSTDPNAHFLQFNTNPATYSSGMASASTGWAVSSTHFRAVGSLALDNGSDNFIAYIFAHDDAQFGTDGDKSIIKCGSYTGTGSGGNRVELGFEPQFVMLKSATYSDAYTGWYMLDTMRGFNTTTSNAVLEANLSNSENPTSGAVKISGNGFELNAGGSEYNKNGETYIYMAIRRPHKPPEAGTDVFTMDTYGGTAPTPPIFNASFPVDLGIFKSSNSTQSWRVGSRLTSGKRLEFDNTGAESSNNSFLFDYQNGWYFGSGTIATTYSWMFKRAPGFMDVVAYTGTGSATTVNHNLGVVPELMIVKSRSISDHWQVYSSVTDETDFLMLNSSDGTSDQQSKWNDTAPTSSVFTVNTDTGVNQSSATYIAYLFATLPGISKVGSYTGTGNDIDVDCGFTNGARFVLIKRTDIGGDWDVMDSVRGISIGNDKHLALNTNTAQGTSSDFIDPLNTGFTVSAAAPNDINQSGGTYLFLAIA